MQKPPYLARVDECVDDVAQKFISAIGKGELGSPKFSQLMNFRAMQNMTRNQKGSKNYHFWAERDWLEAEYYTDVPVNPFARLMAGHIARKMRKSIRKGNAKPIR
jgi:hypothetical protein